MILQVFPKSASAIFMIIVRHCETVTTSNVSSVQGVLSYRQMTDSLLPSGGWSSLPEATLSEPQKCISISANRCSTSCCCWLSFRLIAVFSVSSICRRSRSRVISASKISLFGSRWRDPVLPVVMIELAKFPAEAPKYDWLEAVFGRWDWLVLREDPGGNVCECPGYMDWNGVKGSEPDPDVSVG